MKNGFLFLIFFPWLGLFNGCSNNKSDTESKKEAEQQHLRLLDSVKVGMTYDEVEKLLGKPFQINRGANQLKMASDLVPAELEHVMNFRDSLLQPHAWIQEMEIENVGKFLYVSWVFLQTKQDTNFYFIPAYDSKRDSTRQDKYFVNGVEATQREYNTVDETVYRNEMGKIIDAASWLRMKKDGVTDLRNPMPAQKEIRATYLTYTRIKRSGIQRRYCITYSNFVVLFDASSGRVVTSGHQPFSIKKIGAIL